MNVIQYEQLNILDGDGDRDQFCFHERAISHVDNDDIEGTEFCDPCAALWMAGKPMEMPRATG